MASSRLLALVFVVLVVLSCANASPIRSLMQGKKNVPVPCVMKYFNGFCYIERKAETCTFYSSPSYATYKECAASMGKTLKCAEVPKDQQGGSMGSYADCLDAEPTAAQKAGAKPAAAAAPASGSSGYAKGVVPCVMKNFNSFCYIERKAETCNFYSSPSYATYKDCATSTNMGKTLKCAEVPKDQQTGTYADCLDAEPTAAQKAGAKPAAAAAPAPAASGSSSYAKGVVPCVMKYFNGFCYIERKAETCNFYSSPSYATYKDCAASTNMGKTLKCAEVPKDQQGGSMGSYADCLDAEPTAAQKAGAKPATAKWSQRSNQDVKGLDIACNGKAFCEICGKSLADVQKQCAATPGCKSFTTDKKCFWLKTSGGAATDMVVRSGFDVWVLGA